MKYLLKMGANIKARDSAYRTAFLCAVKRGRTRTAELLLESGADMKSRDDSLRTCIHLAVQYEREDTLRMLLNRDQDELINEKDKDLETPLHYAAKIGSNKVRPDEMNFKRSNEDPSEGIFSSKVSINLSCLKLFTTF